MIVQIRESVESDLQTISDIVQAAFGVTEGREIVQLIEDLAADATAQPVLSLVAAPHEKPVGHILFSKARIDQEGRKSPAAILAPLAVHPDYQSLGIGGRLIAEGLRQLSLAGVDLVFVLGHPGYYPRFGFVEAGVNGFEAPYAILPRNAGAWMVQALRPGILGAAGGKVICAHALDKPKYWRE